jgi:hypothetical protein
MDEMPWVQSRDPYSNKKRHVEILKKRQKGLTLEKGCVKQISHHIPMVALGDLPSTAAMTTLSIAVSVAVVILIMKPIKTLLFAEIKMCGKSSY